jgi:hypothetical protein
MTVVKTINIIVGASLTAVRAIQTVVTATLTPVGTIKLRSKRH